MSRGPEFFRRKAGRRDANHAAIRDGLRALGHFVVDLAGVGGGVPDLCVFEKTTWVDMGRGVSGLASFPTPVWLELKAGKGKLRKSQIDWRRNALSAGLRVAEARTLDEALEAIQ